MVRYLFYTIGDLTYQSPLVVNPILCLQTIRRDGETGLLLRLDQLPALQNSCCVSMRSQHS